MTSTAKGAACAESKYPPEVVTRVCSALYRAFAKARSEFPEVDWISFVAILDVLAVARAKGVPVDVSYLAYELGWPRTTALRRLRRYAEAGYLTLARQGRHTYVDTTAEGRRRAQIVIDSAIDCIDGHLTSDLDSLRVA
jgi:hypothetical protein